MSDDGYCEVNFSDASDDADPVEFMESRVVKARKAHVCSECNGVIAIVDTYKVFAYKFEGEFGSDKMCNSCVETAGEFEYHIVGGSLWLMLREEWEQGAHVQACINRLETARAKEHMRQQWLKWQDEKIARAAQRKTQKAGAVDPHAGTTPV